MPAGDLLSQMIDQIADAVVEKLDERRKVDLIAEAVLERLNRPRRAGNRANPRRAGKPARPAANPSREGERANRTRTGHPAAQDTTRKNPQSKIRNPQSRKGVK